MPKKTVLLLLLLLLLAPGLVLAEEATETSTPDDSELEEYVEVKASGLPASNTIATKLPVSLDRTPANVGIIGARLLEERNARVLGDALPHVSGLHVQSGSGVFDFFVLRGFDSVSSGMIMTDGVPEPESSFHSTYNIEGIEVFKGPAGFLYGQDPLAGAVNLIRKQPLPTDFTSFKGSFGSFSTLNGALDWNRSNDDGTRRFRLNAMVGDSENYRDDKDSNQFAINPSATFELGDDTTLNVNLEFVDAEYSPDSGLPLLNNQIPDVPRRRSYQSPLDRSEQELSRFQVDVEHRFSDTTRLRNKTYYRDQQWLSDGTIFLGVFPNMTTFAPEVNRALTRLDDDQTFIGNQTELLMEVETGSVKHRLLFGVELARRDDDFSLAVDLLTPLDLFDPIEAPNPVLGPIQATTFGAASYDIVAPYAIDQIAFNDKVELLLGVRYDDISFEDTLQGFSRDDSDVSPMLGLVVAPNKATSFYLNAAESFAPASPRAFDAANLEPEEGRQIEIGARRQFLDGNVRTTFAVYEVERDNIPIPDDFGFFQQVGDQRSRGFELELAAEPMERVHAFFSYAYNDAELTRFTEIDIVDFDPVTMQPIFGPVDRSGNTPAMAPEHLAQAWVSKTFPGGFGIAGGLRYFSDQFIDEDNVFETDGALTADATVFYNVSGWRFHLALKNLTDEEYEVRSIVPGPAVIPADGFSAQAGFEVRF